MSAGDGRLPAGFTVLERCWTAGEVASVVGISVSAVYRAAAAGEIPTVKVGRSVRFYPPAIRAWLGQVMPSASEPGVAG